MLLLHLLHLLLVLAAGEENSGLCRQHKHTCCCCCCCLSAAFDAAAVAAYFVLLLWLLPLMCPPYVSLERKNVFRNTNSCSTCSPALFSSKRHCIENRKVLLPCSACCIKREVSEDNKGKGAGKRAPGAGGLPCGHSPSSRARASSMQSRSDARSGVALRRPGEDRPFCTGLGSGLLQHGIGRRCLLWSADLLEPALSAQHIPA